MKYIAMTLCLFGYSIDSWAQLSPSPSYDCNNLYPITFGLIKTVKAGWTRQQMIAQYPPFTNIEPIQSVHEITDELHDYPMIDKAVYAVYRTEICWRRVGNMKPLYDDFKTNYPKLKACEQVVDPKERTMCAMSVAGAQPKEDTI